jgi:hypothetical protein
MFDCLIEPLQEVCSRQATSETNPKSEYRNPKQTLRQKNLKTENPKHESNEACLGFYLFGSFEIVSNFGFRASNFCWRALRLRSGHALRESSLSDFGM